MATKKITELVEITAAANDDVLPIVDISTDITNKIKVENLPISNDVQTALNDKEDLTNKSTSVTTDQASNTKYPSVKAVYDWAVGLFATLTQLATKQDTLVSGTNIKTVNSTSLLGSGDIPIPIVNPSGVAGSIQFSDGSAFSSDATNLFWDNTNKRLGVGTNAPTRQIDVVGSIAASNAILVGGLSLSSNFVWGQASGIRLRVDTPSQGGVAVNTTPISNVTTIIRGWGSTSATTALLVQNSAGNTALTVADDRTISTSGGDVSLRDGALYVASNRVVTYRQIIGSFANPAASAIVEIQSTTMGFLPPRMTTTQKNAISSPASGLQVYDTDLNQMSYYNGSSWINF